MTHRRFIDGIHVTQDEARELMLHHLLLAQRLFEALDESPESRAATQDELYRTFADDEAATAGALGFISALDRYYIELAQQMG